MTPCAPFTPLPPPPPQTLTRRPVRQTPHPHARESHTQEQEQADGVKGVGGGDPQHKLEEEVVDLKEQEDGNGEEALRGLGWGERG